MFYVYTLTDPRDGAVFYVGKGKGLRAWQHASDARKGRKGNKRKTQRVLDIQAAGLEPLVCRVAEYEIEADAFEHEAELIATIPGLTNILARGGGWALTPEEASRRAIERANRIKRQKAEKSRSWLKSWLAWVETWPNGGTFPGLKNGDELAAEFINTVRSLVVRPT